MRANQHGHWKPGRLCTQDLSLGNAFFPKSEMENLHPPQRCWKLSAQIYGHLLLRSQPKGQIFETPPPTSALRKRFLKATQLSESRAGWKYNLLCLVSVNAWQENIAILFSRH